MLRVFITISVDLKPVFYWRAAAEVLLAQLRARERTDS